MEERYGYLPRELYSTGWQTIIARLRTAAGLCVWVFRLDEYADCEYSIVKLLSSDHTEQ